MRLQLCVLAPHAITHKKRTHKACPSCSRWTPWLRNWHWANGVTSAWLSLTLLSFWLATVMSYSGCSHTLCVCVCVWRQKGPQDLSDLYNVFAPPPSFFPLKWKDFTADIYCAVCVFFFSNMRHFKDSQRHCCSLLRPPERGLYLKRISHRRAIGNSIALLPSVCECLTFVDSQSRCSPTIAGRQWMKEERDDSGSSPQILYVPVLILARENTASWRMRNDLLVCLLRLSTEKICF